MSDVGGIKKQEHQGVEHLETNIERRACIAHCLSAGVTRKIRPKSTGAQAEKRKE